MVLVKNCQFFHVFFFQEQQARRMFHDILERKNAFLEYKILKLKKAKKFARKGRREEENGRLIFIHSIVPCASSPVTSVSLVFRVSLCGNKEALEEVIGNTQSLNDNYRLYSKANQEFTTLQNTLFPRNKNNLLFVFTRTIKQKWRSRELISQAA